MLVACFNPPDATILVEDTELGDADDGDAELPEEDVVEESSDSDEELADDTDDTDTEGDETEVSDLDADSDADSAEDPDDDAETDDVDDADEDTEVVEPPPPGIASVVALRDNRGSWQPGVVLAPGLIVAGFSPDRELIWRDFRGEEGTAEFAGTYLEDLIYVYDAPTLRAPPVAFAEEDSAAAVVVGHPEFARGDGGWLAMDVDTEACDSESFLRFPKDDGLDGAAVFDACGGFVGMMLTEAIIALRDECAQELEPAPFDTPLEPFACVSGSQPIILAENFVTLLELLELAPAQLLTCEPLAARPVNTPLRESSVTPAVAAMLSRVRAGVLANERGAAVAIEDPPVVVVPYANLTPGADELRFEKFDGEDFESDERYPPEYVTDFLASVPYREGEFDFAFRLAASDTLATGDQAFMIGHADAQGCSGGWTVSTVTYAATLGNEMIFDGNVFASGAAIVNAAGELVAVSARCEHRPYGILPAPPAAGPLPLGLDCAIIASVPEF